MASELKSFTDVLDDPEEIICDSQPLSLSFVDDSQHHVHGNNSAGDVVPNSDIVCNFGSPNLNPVSPFAVSDVKYRSVFSYPFFNLVQSRVIEDALYSEWYAKFTKLGLQCIAVTGDTDVDFLQLKPYRIIITTPEKWDMLTRRWRDHRQMVEVIKLFLIDEVHILNDETRGPVLEAVVSRMKTIE
ncbi:putative HFM1 protein, partial [Operophtera brumata]